MSWVISPRSRMGSSNCSSACAEPHPFHPHSIFDVRPGGWWLASSAAIRRVIADSTVLPEDFEQFSAAWLFESHPTGIMKSFASLKAFITEKGSCRCQCNPTTRVDVSENVSSLPRKTRRQGLVLLTGSAEPIKMRIPIFRLIPVNGAHTWP